MRNKRAFILALIVSVPALADGGPFGIDHILTRSDTGIYRRSNQLVAMDLSILAVLAVRCTRATSRAWGARSGRRPTAC